MQKIMIIAEIGCNHNGDKELARQMILKAKECNADAVKFQTFKSEELVSCYAPKADYQKETTGGGETQLDMLRKLELSEDAYRELKAYAESLGLLIFSTPFDLYSVRFLESVGQRIWKIPSGEITNLPYLREIGSFQIDNKKVLLSSGMTTIEEVEKSVDVLVESGTPESQITILHCNTEYPTPDEDVNLFAIEDLRRHFPGVALGLSDHSEGYLAAVGAAMLGVTVIEKHFTLDKNMEGPDHKASITPDELKKLCESIRRIEIMAGSGIKAVTSSERKNMVIARKSIVARRDIAAGEAFTEDNITCKRPGNGISPMEWDKILGKKAERAFGENELIKATGFSWQE